MNDDRTRIVVEHHGAPVVRRDYAYSVKRGAEVASFWIDLESKHCEVSATGDSNEIDIPAVYIGATENSSLLREGVSRDDLTGIAFPEFRGWDVHCAWVSKWTLAVCLTKRETA